MASNNFSAYIHDNTDYLSMIGTHNAVLSHPQDFNFSSDSFITFEAPIFLEDQENQSSNINMSQASKKINKSSAKAQEQGASGRVSRKRSNRARNPWTPREDARLVELMGKYGQSWAMISSLMEGRTGKQVRDRFLNKLRPNIKLGDWKPEEDELLVSLCKEVGNRWSLIATHLPGRTEGQVKNRFYSHIKKRLQPDGAISQLSGSKNASECFSSFNNSPQPENGCEYAYEFDADVFNGCIMTVNTQPTQMVTKSAYSFDEENCSEQSTTQGPSSQNGSNSPFRTDMTEPTSAIYYPAPSSFVYEQDLFSVPSIGSNNQIDNILSKVTNYYTHETPKPMASDIDSYFSDELRSEGKSVSEDDRYEQLNRRKAILELALAKTLKEIKSL